MRKSLLSLALATWSNSAAVLPSLMLAWQHLKTQQAQDDGTQNRGIRQPPANPLPPGGAPNPPLRLPASLAHLIPGHSAILMANHGAVTYGDNLLDAFLKMETVEHFANICLVAHQLGSARPLQKLAIEDLLQAKERYVQNALQRMN